jgi:carboxyl-terminal processing protease
MRPASNRTGATVGFPDPCLTPPIPPVLVPYVNTSFNMTGATYCPTIFWTFQPAKNMASVNVVSTGDEPGVLHPVQKMFSAPDPLPYNKFLYGLPMKGLIDPMDTNAGNCEVSLEAIPSAVNLFITP